MNTLPDHQQVVKSHRDPELNAAGANGSCRQVGDVRVVLVGVGGVGAPCAWALVESGISQLTLVDDDRVELANLHRQVLFEEGDVGRSKLLATRDGLLRHRSGLSLTLVEGRALPTTAWELVREADVVVDATDNFASRFLLADACRLARVPIVHAAAIRFYGTVFSVAPGGKPCYRCLFEDLPEQAPDCATGGIVGPVCGVIGGIAAELALAATLESGRSWGHLVSFDGLRDRVRTIEVAARKGCLLCGESPTITGLHESTYLGTPA